MKAVDTLLNVWSWGGYQWKIVMRFLAYIFNLYLQTCWANWVNSLNKYFDPDYINRKATFWVGSDCFSCDISRGIPVLQNRNWSTNIYWAPLSETKYTQHRHTHRHTWTSKQIQMGDFGPLPFSYHVVSGLGPWLCRLYSLVLCPLPQASADTSCINWVPTAEVANRCAGLAVFWYCDFLLLKKRRSVTKKSRGISWLTVPLKLKNIFKTEVFNYKES